MLDFPIAPKGIKSLPSIKSYPADFALDMAFSHSSLLHPPTKTPECTPTGFVGALDARMGL